MGIAHKAQLLILILSATVLGATAQVVVPVRQEDPKQKVENAGPIVVSVDSKGALKLDDRSVTLVRLGRALDKALDERTPPDRVIYIKAAAAVPFSQVLKVLKLGRTIDQDSFGLVLDDGSADGTSGAVITKIILEKPTARDRTRPNPLYLGLAFQKNGGVTLNGESHTLTSLKTQLQEIFKDREVNGVYVEGTTEVERTVFLAPAAATKFRVIVQTALAIKDAGAEPIGIEIDGPRTLVISSINAQH